MTRGIASALGSLIAESVSKIPRISDVDEVPKASEVSDISEVLRVPEVPEASDISEVSGVSRVPDDAPPSRSTAIESPA